MNITATPTTYQIRVYEEGSYEERSPYAAVCTLQVIGEDGYISGYHGKMTLAIRRKFREVVTELGLKCITWERENRKVEAI